MKHFGYTTGGAVVVQNISSCRPLDSFNFSTKCLLPGMPNWGAVLKLRTNICTIWTVKACHQLCIGSTISLVWECIRC